MELSKDGKSLLSIQIEDIDSDGSFTLPESVEIIAPLAAQGKGVSERLVTIDIKNAVTIGAQAFYICDNLENVIGFPKEVHDFAFYGCRKLKGIDLSNAVILGNSAFLACGMRQINISKAKDIPLEAFRECVNLARVIGAPEFLAINCFYGCTALEEFDFTNVEYIGDRALFSSGLEKYIKEEEYRIFINSNGYKAEYAKINMRQAAFRISGVINEKKRMYVDVKGTPFAIVRDDYRDSSKVSFKTNKEKFLELWNAS